MSELLPGRASNYLRYLPAVFQEGAAVGRPNFLGRFLLAFEQVLSGGLGLRDKYPALKKELSHPGLEEELSDLDSFFDPERAPTEFLPWLAGWVALLLRADLDEKSQRNFIAAAVSLYRLRGTPKGLANFIQIYTNRTVEIHEQNTPFQIGVHSQVGADTWLDGCPPHHFSVHVRLATSDAQLIAHSLDMIRAIIAQEKPAHTVATLTHQAFAFQIGDHSTIGVDTLLGPEPGGL